jgi:hypothetical protein
VKFPKCSTKPEIVIYAYAGPSGSLKLGGYDWM